MDPKWKESELEGVSKKDLVEYLQAHGGNAFLKRHKLNGQLASVTKNSSKSKLDEAYKDLFATKEFRTKQDDDELAQQLAEKKTETPKPAEEKKPAAPVGKPAPSEAPKFKKVINKKGDGSSFPQKGDTVQLRFKGTCMSTGKVFQDITAKKDSPFEVKVGAGKLIRGWDEALLTMSVGEKATVTIEPEWAYGAKGLADGGIGPNETLIFEIELISLV